MKAVNEENVQVFKVTNDFGKFTPELLSSILLDYMRKITGRVISVQVDEVPIIEAKWE